jgi:hypothetical protein
MPLEAWNPTGRQSWLRSVTASPEWNVSLFSFLLHFVWETWQMPFYEDGVTMPHWTGIGICTRATLGDVGIALFAFGIPAYVQAGRLWILSPKRIEWATYLAVGLLITIVFEYVAVEVLGRWSYAVRMPTLPPLGTGLLPILQWIVIPILVVPLAARQVRGARVDAGPLEEQ